ncbi:hypothetical protein [Planctomicrobium sp. SH527]|uniref:hypothetical protein n=1 Tax=Planctomicrobium sp. SH527 TaxID=3448123 RepID=UPI003F5B5A91
MHTSIKFRCQYCGTKISAKEYLVGKSRPCPSCSSLVRVPANVPPQLPLATTAMTGAMTGGQMFQPPLAEAPRWQQMLAMEAAPTQCPAPSIPVEIRLPGKLGGLKARVDQTTSNSMAMTFLGGALVVLGAILFSLLGIKRRIV